MWNVDTGDEVIDGARWTLMKYSFDFVSRCGLDMRWYVHTFQQAGLAPSHIRQMDIGSKDGKWWVLPAHANGNDTFELIGPYDTTNDAYVAMTMLLAMDDAAGNGGHMSGEARWKPNE